MEGTDSEVVLCAGLVDPEPDQLKRNFSITISTVAPMDRAGN